MWTPQKTWWRNAKENIALSGLSSAPVRYIVDDCAKFVQREIRRGSRYDGNNNGSRPATDAGRPARYGSWKTSCTAFVKLCTGVLSEKPLFMLINSYTTGLQPIVLRNILASAVKPLFSRKGGGGRGGAAGNAGDILLPAEPRDAWSFD